MTMDTTPEANDASVEPTPVDIAVVTQRELTVTGQEIKKKDLVEAIVEATGEKKSVVKNIIETTLEHLGAAIARNDVLNLQPLGKIQVFNEKDTPAATVYKCKVRQVKQSDEAQSD